MNNTIAIRVYDFLKNHPPFSLVEKERLLKVAEKVVIQYYEPQQIIFEQDSPTSDFFYVVKEGAVQILRKEMDNKILVDECDEGDVFGIRPLLAKRPYVVTAEAIEETLIYAIHTNDFQDIFKNNSEVAFYLASNFAAGVRNQFAKKENKGQFYYGGEKEISSNYKLVDVQSIEQSKEPVVCTPQTQIKEAAKLMSKNGVGSIIVVDPDFRPVGITTDRDFRQQVVTGLVATTQPISEIMSSPVVTIPPDRTVADVQIEMLQNRIHHLCITEDGTIHSKVLGIISEHDLLVVQANNPAVLIREIKKGKSGAALRVIRDKAEVLLEKYLEQEVSIKYISDIMSEINDALIIRAIQIAENDLEVAGYKKPTANFCWLALGSEGRKEQLLRTDQDNALVFENVAEEDYEEVKNYYLALAENTTLIIHECGFEYCPADMMASNPQWCMSLEKWEQQFSKWMNQPGAKEVMMTTIFFDYRPIFGNFDLATTMTEHIFEGVDQQEIYLSHLANNALQNPPPLSFFRNFMVEKNGEHKDHFDLKGRAMMPLADAARVLILNAKVGQVNNTFARFEKMAELEENNRELYEQAADAYEILMRFRANQGLKRNDGGRFVNPSKLNKMERLMLRNSFQPIHELHKLLKIRFRLNLLG